MSCKQPHIIFSYISTGINVHLFTKSGLTRIFLQCFKPGPFRQQILRFISATLLQSGRQPVPLHGYNYHYYSVSERSEAAENPRQWGGRLWGLFQDTVPWSRRGRGRGLGLSPGLRRSRWPFVPAPPLGCSRSPAASETCRARNGDQSRVAC